MIAEGRFQTLLNGGQFVLSSELTPPRHYNVSQFVDKAAKISPYVDVVQINDNLVSQARLSNVLAAHFIQQAGLEPIVQINLRYKNRSCLQTELLGLAALGIRNVMVLGSNCLIGDTKAGNTTEMNSLEAINAIHNLTTYGRMFNGDVISPPPKFYVGAIASFPSFSPIDLEESINRIEAKIYSGARYIQLQTIFDLDPIQPLMKEIVACGLHKKAHFIAAVFPFSSLKGLEFLQRIPGLSVPKELLERLAEQRSRAESLKLNLEIIESIRKIEGIRGLHIRSVRSLEYMSRLVESAGLQQAFA